ncbi:MAG TPA: HEAT repeat domain-containing protein [Longimicrobiaceae bacterium]|nr:HEAT repeat domain-containing protein [Longimicrobiaceae bacterium]
MTVEHTGRPVRVGDATALLEQLLQEGRLPDTLGEVEPNQVVHSMMSLAQTGDLVCVRTLRGGSRDGGKLYLPADADPAAFQAPEPVTWIEQVAATVDLLWTERVTQAEMAERRPRPMSTGEIRARLAALHPGHERLRDPQLLVNAIRQLSLAEEPLVRAVRRPGERAILWVPAAVPGEDVDLGDAYASDAERIREAVARAEGALGRPVTVRDVRDELDRDPSLRPAGKQGPHALLNDVARKTLREDTSGSRRLLRAGTVEGRAYYTSGEMTQARGYLEWLQAASDWDTLAFPAQVEAIRSCALPSAAAGRLRLLQAEMGGLAQRVAGVLNRTCLTPAVRSDANDLASDLGSARSETDRILASLPVAHLQLPAEVSGDVAGWTAEELRGVLAPFYPAATEEMPPGKFAAMLGWKVRRIPNPGYVSRWSEDHRTASTYLFDRADALLHAALRWGGTECRLHASLASSELGTLRDPRFLTASLTDPNPDRRLVAVACLAFVATGAVCGELLRVIRGDRDAGVRRSALWGYAFAGGAGTRELVIERAEKDPDRSVRATAQAAGRGDSDWWWKS